MTPKKIASSSSPLPPVRYRTRTGLRKLDTAQKASALFPPDDARHDRIKATVRASVHVAQADFQAIMHGWDERDGIGAGLLRCSGARGSNRWRIYTPKEKSKQNAKLWLFHASGTATWVPENGLIAFELDVDLNPTRFYAHQTSSDLAEIAKLDPLDALRLDPERRDGIKDQTLDGSDNVIIGRDRFSDLTVRGVWWRQVVETYLGHVRAALVAAFAPSGTSARLDRFVFEAARVAEVHWELEHPGAIHWVDTLRKRVLEADAAAIGVTFVSQESEGNSTMLKVELTKDIKLKVYPKMFGRIRVELEYAGRIKSSASKRGRYTSTDFIDTLMRLKDDAAGRLHKFWDEAMALGNTTDDTVSLAQFITSVVRAAQDADAVAVLNVLIANRRLAQTGPGSFASKPVCEALERDGVIVRARLRSRATPQYALAPSYARMLEAEAATLNPSKALH